MKTPKKENLKAEVRNWWNEHPMDYLGGWGIPSADKDDEFQVFLQAQDEAFYRAAYFAQKKGAPLFSNIIDYPSLQGKDVLEVGCGMGGIAAQFAKAGARITALDVTGRAVRMTRKRFSLGGLPGRFINGDAEALPFPDARFDFIWSWGVLHHTPSIEKAVDEIHRVLKPGGQVAVMLYHKRSLYNYVNVILRYGIIHGKLLTRSIQDLRNYYTDGKPIGGCPLASYFSKSEAQQLFSRFRNLKMSLFSQKEGIVNAFPNIGNLRPFLMEALPEWFFDAVHSRLGFALFIEAEKPGTADQYDP